MEMTLVDVLELFGRCALQIYLLSYLLTYLQDLVKRDTTGETFYATWAANERGPIFIASASN